MDDIVHRSMASSSDNPAKVNPQNPATMSQPAAKDNHDPNPEATRGNSPTSVFVNSEPVREEQVQNAVKFLSHPSVRGSPVMYRRSFLEREGFMSEEIDEAFRRVPVIMEEEDKKGAVKGRPSLAEEAAVAAKAAAAAAADVARASQEMLASKTEEKRYFEELTNLLNYQVREMKSMSSALEKLEVRSLSLPASMEPSITPHPKSYMDDINNQPPNAYQPVPNSRVGPMPKPWEIGQSQNILRNFLRSQGSGDGLNYDYQVNLTNGDRSTPWWQRKNARITEVNAENEQKFGYTAAPTEG